MNLKTQKKLAASVLGVSKNNIVFDPERLEDIKEAITKTDMRGLVADKAVKAKQTVGTSRVRVRKNIVQKRKGLRSGASTKKGTKNARLNEKETWMKKIRLQRAFLRELRESNLILGETYTKLYAMTKGNYFRSKRHMKLYLEENNLLKKNEKKK